MVVVTLVLITANGCAVVNEDLDLESRLAKRGFTSPVVESDGTVGGAGLLKVAFTMAPHQELLDQRVMEASRLAWTTYDYRFDEVRVTVRRGTATTRRTLSREALQAAFGPRPAQLKDRTIAAQETRSDVQLGVGLLAFVMLVTTAVWLLVVFLRRARPSEQRPPPYWRPQPAPAFGGSPALPLAGGSHYHPTARTQSPPTPRPVLDPETAKALQRYRLRGALLVSLGPVLLIAAAEIAAVMQARADRLLASGRRVPGTVVEMREGNPTARISPPDKIVVRYEAEDSTRQATINLDDESPRYRVGQQVEVVYDPDDPDRVRTSEEDNDPSWAVTIFVYGLVWAPIAIVVGIVRLVRAGRWRRQLERDPRAVIPELLRRE